MGLSQPASTPDRGQLFGRDALNRFIVQNIEDSLMVSVSLTVARYMK
jgi:hypothetical protein